MRRYRPLLAALLLQLVGAGGALLISIQSWQHLTARRPSPFPDVRVDMTGRDVDSAITALALVALAGVVAVLATRGRWRRVVGVVVALAGVGIVVRAAMSAGAVSDGRARDFVTAHRQTVTATSATDVRIDVLTAWPVLTLCCGVLVLGAGALIALRGGRWEGMSARYDVAPGAGAGAGGGGAAAGPAADDDSTERQAKAAASMWTALDRGEDPTAR